ncbi:MAG: hypothetical protein K6G84_12515 [Lachnospiraceae bacterium]|nr:hypothetical protein [Lachnospiraceae bacterium]
MLDPGKQNKQDNSSENIFAGLLDSDIVESVTDLASSAVKKDKEAADSVTDSTSEITESVGSIAESAVEHVGDLISGLFD